MEATENVGTQQVGMTKEQALAKVETLSGNFKIACSKCGTAKGVRKDIFAKRVEKAYAAGSDLVGLMKTYLCVKCRRAEGLNFMGAKKASGSANAKVVEIDDLID